MEPVKVEEYKGYKIEIHQDEPPENPRDCMDELGTIVYWHSRYTLGGKQDLNGRREYPDESPQEVIDRLADGGEYLPLYLMDHSGLSLRTSDSQFRACDSAGWDWGQVGWIFCPRDTIVSEYGDDSPDSREKCRRCLQGDVDTFGDYLSGDVYGWSVTGPDGERGDSCWGYYGDSEWPYMLQCGREAVDCTIEAATEQATLCACVI